MSHSTYRSFGDNFTGLMTQPTVSQHWRTMASSQLGHRPSQPDSAYYKAKQRM